MQTQVLINDIRAVPIARAERKTASLDGLVVSGLMFLSVILSLFFINQSLRLDEAQSLWQTSGSFERMLQLLAEDVHVPLYHILLYGWQQLFGQGVEIARLLSLIFFVLTVPAVYYLARVAYNRSTALFASTIAALSPFLNWYGSEIRMYSMLTFFAVVNQICFLKIFRRGHSVFWTAYLLTAVIGIYTHYFFGLLLAAQALFFFLYKKDFPSRSLSKFVMVALLVGLSLAPWIWYVREINTGAESIPLLAPPTSINVFNTFSQFVFGFQSDAINTILVSLWPLSVIIFFLALSRGRRVAPETIFFLICLTVPIALAYIISLTFRPIFLSRYLILALPSLYLFVSWLFSTYSRRLSWIFKTALILVMLLTLSVEAMSTTNPIREDYRSVSEYLGQHALPNDIVYISAPFTIYPIEYYYQSQAPLETIPRWDRQASGPIPPLSNSEMRAQVAGAEATRERAWVVTSYDQGYENEVVGFFDANFRRLYEREFSPGLVLRLYQF